MITKKKMIEIIKYEYGITAKEATKFYNECSEKALQEIYNGFAENAKKSFYDD